jgi:predicted membrane protein DUF2157
MSADLKSMLARWQSAGLIDGRQAQAIEDYEAKSGPGQPASAGGGGSITTTEVLTYAGALVTIAGLGTLLGTQYRQLGAVGRLGIPALVAIASLLAAAVLPGKRARAHRAQTSLVTLAIAAVAFFTGQFQVEIAGGPTANLARETGQRILLVSALVASLLTAGFLSRLRAGLLAAALSVSLLISGIAFIGLTGLDHGWPVEAVFIAIGLVLVGTAEYGRRQHILWATEILAFSGGLLPIVVAFITAQDGNLPLELFAGVLAAAAFAAAVSLGSAGYAFAGGLGLFAFVLDIEFRYFRSSLGFAISLVISGLALLGVALLLARLLPRLRRNL